MLIRLVLVLVYHSREEAAAIIAARDAYLSCAAEGINVLVLSNLNSAAVDRPGLILDVVSNRIPEEALTFLQTLQDRGQLLRVATARDLQPLFQLQVEHIYYYGRLQNGKIIFPDHSENDVAVRERFSQIG